MIRVLIADDSSTARQLLREVLRAPGIAVVGEATNGREAVEAAERLRPDLVIMDVHMPEADGLEATKEIMVRCPTPIVIVSSAVNQREVELSLSATQAGALLALPKPGQPGTAAFESWRDQLITMVRAMSTVKVVRRWAPGVKGLPAGRRRQPRPLQRVERLRAVVAAASTGGPPALRRILMDLPRDFPVPVLVVQHIARGFAAGFAEWLAGSCALHVTVAAAGARLAPRTVYIAPDDVHLGIASGDRVLLSDAAPIGGFRPAASFLFQTAAEVLGGGVAALVLTGMGTDGADGLAAVKRAGGCVLAQDEASSVVYGMAQEAVRRGLADRILPLEEIAHTLIHLVGEGGDEAD
jgi:two-component system, chemotaxis family, protein-glutamate methylesterase/glutaminase